MEEDRPGRLAVTLARPQVRNAFNDQMIQELSQVFAQEAMDSKIRMVLLKGDGPCFCAGGDLNWMKQAVDYSQEENLADTLRLTRMFNQLNEFPKPVMGAIHGAAIGGGVGLVSILDLALTSQETVFSLSEVRLGLVPACIGPFVIPKIGASHARYLFMSAERFSAQKAHEVGLVHQVLPDKAALQERVERLSDQVLQCGPAALAQAKELILHLSWPEKRATLKDPLEYVSRLLAELRVTDEGQEGVRAFLEKRKPSWLKE